MGGGGQPSVQSAESPLILILCQFIVEIFWQKYVETLFTIMGTFFPNPCIFANFVLDIILVPSLVTNMNFKTFFVIDLLRICLFTKNVFFYNLGNGWFFM